ncbi:MAG: AMP-binding protein [Polyangiaceae bacterium]
MSSPLISRLFQLRSSRRDAIVHEGCGRSFTDLLDRAVTIAGRLRTEAGVEHGQRVAILASPSAPWVEAYLAVILAGGIAVPLSPSYPPVELAWFADDADATAVIYSADQAERAAAMLKGRVALRIEDLDRDAAKRTDATLPMLDAEDIALLLYTSGTTGKPKGAMITHANVAIQAEIMREAWSFSPSDTLLHALPLHHLHGLGISMMTSLLSGATTRMLPKFEAARVWDEIASGGVTVWMAVPTMYQKLFEALDAAPPDVAERWKKGASALRLATSGSAALPVRLAERWRAITGAIPLERFGMTEIGVGLTNPLTPSDRRPGWVGRPPRTVEICIVDEDRRVITSGAGELLVRGPSVFKGYFRRPEATESAFASGWFLTGDRAERDETGAVRLLGRTSVDILKSGGEKLSALEIEETLREHTAVREVAVVGLPDETWGERVVAAIVAEPGRETELTTDAVRAWSKERMAPYKAPREVVLMPSLPRNALGKVVKPELIAHLKSRAI